MFKKIQNKTSRNINVVHIDGTNIENLGLYLDKDFELSYVQEREVEEKPVPGREMPWHIVKKKLPIEFSIEFNIKETTDFYGKIDYIRNFLEKNRMRMKKSLSQEMTKRFRYVTMPRRRYWHLRNYIIYLRI